MLNIRTAIYFDIKETTLYINFIIFGVGSHLGNVNNAHKISFPEPNLILGSGEVNVHVLQLPTLIKEQSSLSLSLGIFEGDLLFFTKQHGVISLSAFPPTPSASPPKKIKYMRCDPLSLLLLTCTLYKCTYVM